MSGLFAYGTGLFVPCSQATRVTYAVTVRESVAAKRCALLRPDLNPDLNYVAAVDVDAGAAAGTVSSRLAFSNSARRTMAASMPLKISRWIGYSPYQ